MLFVINTEVIVTKNFSNSKRTGKSDNPKPYVSIPVVPLLK
jgi:hypothetical protein